MAQIVSCSMWLDKTAVNNNFLEALKDKVVNCEAHTAGRLRLFDIMQVNAHEIPLHPLFSATWRRYLYVLPLHFTNESCKIVTDRLELDKLVCNCNLNYLYYLDINCLNAMFERYTVLAYYYF